MQNNTDIYQALKSTLDERNITVADFCKTIGFTRAALHAVFTGLYNSEKMIKAINRVLPELKLRYEPVKPTIAPCQEDVK